MRGGADGHRLDELEEAVRETRRRLLAELEPEGEPAFDLAGLQARVEGTQATLLVYHLRGSRSSVTVLAPGWDAGVVPLNVHGHELTRRVRELTTAVRTVDPAWRPHARALYRDLVEPAEGALPEPGDGPPPLLGSIPFGGAHAVPFEVLVEEGRPLVARFDVLTCRVS